MRELPAFCMRLLGLLRPISRERDLSDEIEGNIALIVEEHLRAGLDPKEARRRAALEFGNSELMKQACRERMGLPLGRTILGVLATRRAQRRLRGC